MYLYKDLLLLLFCHCYMCYFKSASEQHDNMRSINTYYYYAQIDQKE